MQGAPGPFDRIDGWCAGRNAWIRAPLVLLLCWSWMGHAADPSYRSVFGGLNLGVHELGHFVFGPFGDVTSALGGSLLQCVLPLVGMAMFARQRDLFAVAVAFGWLGTNLFETATYAGDAVAMRLPLVTPGGGHAIHDWNYVLGAKGWLRHADAIETTLRGAAHACLAIATCGGAWLLSRIIRLRRAGEGHAGDSPAVTESALRAPRRRLRPWSEPAPSGLGAPEKASTDPRRSRTARAPSSTEN